MTGEVQPLFGPPRPRTADDLPARYNTLGFWEDIRTGRWMLVPREYTSSATVSSDFLLTLQCRRSS